MPRYYIEIKTERLLIRPVCMADLECVHKYSVDKENLKYMRYLPHESKEETINYIKDSEAMWEKEKQTAYEFVIVLDEKIIGWISLICCENEDEIELGWLLNKEYHGKGYAVEAAEAIKDFAINKLGFKTLIAHCDYRNIGSAKLMEKIGMTLEDDTGTRINRLNNEESRELFYIFKA